MARATGRLSIFAGSGSLVPHVIDAALAAGYKVQVLALAPRPDIKRVKVVVVKLDNPLGIVWHLKLFRTSHIVLAGGIELPEKAREGLIRFANGNAPAGEATSAVPVGDAEMVALTKVLKNMTGADLMGVHELSPELLTPNELIAGPVLTQDLMASARFALKTARAVGALSLGQAAVVAGHRVIAAEDIGGTDALIARVGELRRAGLTGDGAMPLVLAKARQPQQSALVDLPAIGPDTVDNCAAAGIGIIVAEAGSTLVLERAQLEQAAMRTGISVLGLELDHE
jgi:DUF1009 family protein